MYPIAPPKDPPTAPQKIGRLKFTAAAKTWRALTPTQRADYERATRRLSLRVTGYNLWVYASTTGDWLTIATIARQSQLPLHTP